MLLNRIILLICSLLIKIDYRIYFYIIICATIHVVQIVIYIFKLFRIIYKVNNASIYQIRFLRNNKQLYLFDFVG